MPKGLLTIICDILPKINKIIHSKNSIHHLPTLTIYQMFSEAGSLTNEVSCLRIELPHNVFSDVQKGVCFSDVLKGVVDIPFVHN